eukprot:1691813-Rhodomonas_salina.1
MTADGTEVDAADLKGKTVGVYFSAGWCQPCKVFTPQLIQVHPPPDPTPSASTARLLRLPHAFCVERTPFA